MITSEQLCCSPSKVISYLFASVILARCANRNLVCFGLIWKKKQVRFVSVKAERPQQSRDHVILSCDNVMPGRTLG